MGLGRSQLRWIACCFQLLLFYDAQSHLPSPLSLLHCLCRDGLNPKIWDPCAVTNSEERNLELEMKLPRLIPFLIPIEKDRRIQVPPTTTGSVLGEFMKRVM